MNTESNESGFFYGWVIVFAGLLIMVTIGGVAWNCVSQFIKPVCAELGFSRRAMSTNSTITSLTNMAVALSWGYILRHFSLKKLMRLAVVTLGISYFGYSMCTNIWMFYGCSVVLGLSLALLMTLPLSIIIANWFEEKRGLAYGITYMGSGLGGMIFNPIVASMIINIGWRMTYRIMAGIMFAAAFIAVYFLLKIRPEEMGLKALGHDRAVAERGGEDVQERGPLFKELIHTRRFIIVAVALTCGNTAIGCITQCLSPHLTDSGYTVQRAAFYVSMGLGALAVGKMLLGEIYDRIGTRRATLLAMSCGFIGLVAMIFCRNTAVIPLIILGQGLGCALGTVGVPLVVEDLFGKRDYAANFGFISACSSVGGAISPMLNGAAYDISGSYNPAFTMWCVLLAVSLMVFFKLLPKKDGAGS